MKTREEAIKEAKFDVEIKSTGIDINAKGLSYDAALALVEQTIKDNPEDEKLNETYNNQIKNSFGFCSRSHGDFEFRVSAYRERREIENPEESEQTCPRRMNEFGPQKRSENLDKWEMRGDDECCSYCGSIKPERVIELVKEHGAQIAQRTDKSYKWYIRRPSVPNAGFGGIKFYVQHFSQEHIDEFNETIRPKPVEPVDGIVFGPTFKATPNADGTTFTATPNDEK